MGDRRCATCVHFRAGHRQGWGMCMHPAVRQVWPNQMIKRKSHACLSLGRDYWEAANEQIHRMLGKILLDMHKITRTQLEAGLAVQKAEGFRRRIGEIWIALGYATREDVEEALRRQGYQGNQTRASA